MDYINHVFAQTVIPVWKGSIFTSITFTKLIRAVQKYKKKKKKIKNAKKFTRHFEANFSNIYEDLDNDTSQGEESEENEHKEETSTIKPTQTPKPVKKDKTPSKIRKPRPEKESSKSKSKKMPCSTAKDTCLRGVYIRLTPSKHQKSMLLKYRKPLTAELKRKMKIDSYEFKYHYTSGNELLLDFQRYENKFAIKTVQGSSQ